MQATILDLRYRMNDILKALDRNEKVSILYHGKLKGELMPVKHGPVVAAQNHALFGIRNQREDVNQIMDDLRGGRHRDL